MPRNMHAQLFQKNNEDMQLKTIMRIKIFSC